MVPSLVPFMVRLDGGFPIARSWWRGLVWTLAGLGVVVGAVNVRGEPPRERAVGPWSRPVSDSRGYALRGRLVMAERQREEGLREVAVYVELQDASEHVGGTMRVFCDLGKTDFREPAKSGLHCELRGPDKRPVPSTTVLFSGAVPSSQWVLLPSDSTIRLRASPFGLYRRDSLMIASSLGSQWEIPADDRREYSLSGTFTVDPEEGRTTIQDPHIWRGTLDLPALTIVAGPADGN
ncbi:MAG: hypothetical protein U0935_12420 [Pirellulales bacterium]